MKSHFWYAVVAASLGMAVTSGLVAYATAGSSETNVVEETAGDSGIEAHLDQLITAQLDDIKRQLDNR